MRCFYKSLRYMQALITQGSVLGVPRQSSVYWSSSLSSRQQCCGKFWALHTRFKVSLEFVDYFPKDHLMLCYALWESRLVCTLMSRYEALFFVDIRRWWFETYVGGGWIFFWKIISLFNFCGLGMTSQRNLQFKYARFQFRIIATRWRMLVTIELLVVRKFSHNISHESVIILHG